MPGKATVVKPESYLVKMNRFVVQPTMAVDIFWNAPAPGKPENISALSIFFTEEDGQLYAVSYMNDHIAAEI